MNIALCCVARDEEKVIGRLIDSCLPIISSYFILIDDRTTDSTEKICREKLANLPGVIQKWKFTRPADGRQKMFDECKADFALFMDAKDELVIKGELPELTADGYYIMLTYGSIKYPRLKLCRLGKEWKVQHKKHPVWGCKGAKILGLRALEVISRPGQGARSHVEPYKKYMQDAIDIEQSILDGDNSPRNQFYLAQSYKDAGDPELAIIHYDRRIKMGGWDEEIYMSKYARAICKWRLSKEFPLEDFMEAYKFRPTRLEALYQIVRHHRANNEYERAYDLASRAVKKPYPETDKLFIEFQIWEWRMKDELAVSAYWTGKYEECEKICNELLNDGKIPEGEVERVKKNRKLARQKLNPPS